MTPLLLQAASTLPLVGLIWTIQLVHYPLMDDVAPARFPGFHTRHARAITWLVGPLMLAELTASSWIALSPPPGVPPLVGWTGLALTILAWAATALISVPLHGRLADGFDAAAHRRLVRTNWFRTAAWSLRGGLALWMLQAGAA